MSQFDPQKHHRRSIRLDGYDYSQPGAYFVTLVTYRREAILGEIIEEKLRLSPSGEALWEVWQSLPGRYPEIRLDEAVIMPNHFHGILWIKVGAVGAVVGAVHEPPQQSPNEIRLNRRRMILPMVIGYLKMNSAKRINQILNSTGLPVWQRDYYERIIRDEHALNSIRAYIRNNVLKWKLDGENPQK
jgi:REP element-mobilizing transposase RayT